MLTFSVNKQVLQRTDENIVVADSVEYLTATFTFSEDWVGTTKTVLFNYGAITYGVMLEGDTCVVPWEVIHSNYFRVSVYGVKDDERITTNNVTVYVGESGYTEGGEPQPPTPSQIEQILEILSKLTGGAANKVLAKKSSQDYDFKWVNNEGGGGGGSSVEWTQLLESGTKIATITIDDDPYDVYAPTPFSGDYNDLTNKPTIPAAQVNSDWNANSGVAQILNKPTLFSGDYNDLTNKPTIPAAQVNSDWNANSGVAQILNKPTLFSGDYNDLTNKPTIPAAQVNSDWNANSGVAQILNKPTIPTKTSDLQNDSGFLTSHQSIKTLNGETLVGTGDVSTYQSETVTVSEGTASKQLTAHKLCYFDGAAVTLTITLPASISISDEFNFIFATSVNGCVLTVPNSVKWDGGTAPTLEANTLYEVSIDGLGVALISQGVSTI